MNGRSGLAVMLAMLLVAPVAGAAELYVTNTYSGTISIIDTDRDEVVGTIPLGGGVPNRIVLTPDGRHAWVIHDKTRKLSIVDPVGRKVLRQVKIGEWPYNLAFSPDGRYAWVLDWGDVSRLLIYDIAKEAVEASIEVSTWPAHGIFSRDGRLFWVTSETAGNVAVVDADQTPRASTSVKTVTGVRIAPPQSRGLPRSRDMISFPSARMTLTMMPSG